MRHTKTHCSVLLASTCVLACAALVIACEEESETGNASPRAPISRDDGPSRGSSIDGAPDGGEGGGGQDAAREASPPDPVIERELSAGGDHTCRRLGPGMLKCWGLNQYGQLGLGNKNNRGDNAGEMGAALPAVDVGAGRTVAEISAGSNYHTCARLDDGSVKCWGYNNYGELGLGNKQHRGDNTGEMGAALPALDLGPGRTARQISVGFFHACAVLDDRSVKCWGDNYDGELGLGDTKGRGDEPGELGAALPAIDFGAGRTAVEIAAGGEHTCVLLDDGSVKCWGRNHYGQLGLGDTRARGRYPGEMGAALPAVDLGPGRTAIAIYAGGQHSCARLDDRSVKCWGYNSYGCLGLGDVNHRGDNAAEMGASLPAIDFGPGRRALQIAGGSQHTCALLDDGSIKCFGRNYDGQLGRGDTISRGDQPGQMGAALAAVDLGPGRTALEVAAGAHHNCARLDDGSIKCWGANELGQLGLGDIMPRGDQPMEMGANLPVVQLK